LEDGSTVAVVEYIGQFPRTPSFHGNGKKSQGEYIRTDKHVKDKIIKAVESGKRPREIYADMLLNDSINAPRDLKRIQTGKFGHRDNIADEIQHLLSRIHDDDYIQEPIYTKGKPPSSICYTKEQLEDFHQCA
jgi:hypothetical protein